MVRAADLVAMGVPRAEVDALEPAAHADGWLVAPTRAKEAVSTLASAVRAHDTADPLDPGLTIEAARRAAQLPTPGLVAAVLGFRSALSNSGLLRDAQAAPSPRWMTGPTQDPPNELELREGRVHLRQARELPERVRAALEAVRSDLCADPFHAPEADRLAELGLGTRELAALVRAGELIAIADGVVLLPDAPDRAVKVLRGLGPAFTLSEARQALGTTRRVAVPLLEYLARTGRTIRADDLTHRLR
jgi:selenocysteine-specific elongation factor